MNLQSCRKATLQLSLIPGFGPRKYNALFSRSKWNSIAEFLDIDDTKKLLFKHPLNPEVAQEIAEQMSYVCIWEDHYPSLLKNIADPPIVLYYIGNYALINRDLIAVVGTRRPTNYGKQWTAKLATDLASHDIVVVSGMAFGVDKLAHQAALQAGPNSTIAVLASSVNDPTPVQNIDVYRNILDKGGLIVSATAPQTIFSKGLFPSRNRIIAGMSRAVVVIEAGEKSGALITADLAFDYDRQVFALPGNLSSPQSYGTNLIIKQNKAKLIQSPDDIYIELNYKINNNVMQIAKSSHDQDALSSKLLQAIRNGNDNLELLKSYLPEVDNNAILSKLGMLEIDGLIVRSNDGTYQLVI